MMGRRNSTKVWAFLLLVSIGFLFFGFKIGDRFGLFIGFALAVCFNVLIFFYGDSRILEQLRAQRLEGKDPWNLLRLVESFAARVQLPMPAVYVVESETATAFSVGQSRKRGALCITTGLLQKLSVAEVEAVIAHQVCHIHCLNTFGFGVSHTLANIFMGLGQFLDRMWPADLFRNPKLQHPFLNFFSPLAWMFVRMSVSDKVYFENDELAASMLQDRKSLAQALWKLEALNQARPLKLPPCSSHFFIVNPMGPSEKNWFLLAHPKIDTRLKRLVGYFPL